MWERGERERLIREDCEQQDKAWIKEQDKTINNKSSIAFNDTILNFEQIFTVSERDKFKNRDFKRTNTIEKFDEIFDSMDISQRASADSSEQSIEDKDDDLTDDDDENDETIKSEDNSIIEVLEDHPDDLAEEIFKELDTQIFQDELDSSEDNCAKEEIESRIESGDMAVSEESNQLESISEESESEDQGCEAAVCDGLASIIIAPESSESEDSGFDVETAKRFSRSSSGSPVAMLARSKEKRMMMRMLILLVGKELR